MKKWSLCILLLLPLLPAEAQVIRYDTVTVSGDDERNIYRHQQKDAALDNPSTPPKRSASEEQPLRFNRSRLRIGANLGLSVSNNFTRLGIGPQVGYQFHRSFMAGAGIKYYYSKSSTTTYITRNNLLGVNLFGYLYPLTMVAAFVQPELNYIRSRFTEKEGGDERAERGVVPSLVVGAGLRLGRSHITLNYDLVQQINSPHPKGFYLGVSAFF